ncbi:MAG: hypothetical protein Q7R45_08620 [Sulfuricaulis sp.]|nr:hypothetical protein [Sulfuricaulis sp.]
MYTRHLPLLQKSFFLFGPRGARALGFEVKSGGAWRSQQSKALKELVAAGSLERAYGIYLGRDVLRDGPVEILPLQEFQRRLRAGRILVA